MIDFSRGPGRFQDVKLPKGGWLRIAVRAGLAIGMVGQLAVLSDLKAVIGVAASPSGHWIIGIAALSAVLAVLASVALLVALLERRSPKATVASGIGCLLAWSYYAATYQWAYFAAQRDGGLHLLPLFPLLFVATAVALGDGDVDVRQAKATGFRFTLGSIREMEDAELLVPIVYGVTAVILLAHPFLFRFNLVIRGGLDFSIAGRMWPERFAYLQVLAGLALLSAAMFRKAARPLSDSLAFNGSIMGCLYGVWALDKLGEYIGIVRRFPGPIPVSRSGETIPWILLAASLVPLLFALLFAVLDLKKSEPAGQVILRAAACFCFVAFLFSAYLDRYRGLSPGAAIDQQHVFVFGLAYLLCAFHSVSTYDYALGTGLGQAIVVLGIMSLLGSWHKTSGALAIGASNLFLLAAASIGSLGRKRSVREGRVGPVLTGFGVTIAFAGFLFMAALLRDVTRPW